MAGIEIVHVYQKKRREFGRHPMFHDRAPMLHINTAPTDLKAEWTERQQCHLGIQSVPMFSQHDAQTERYFTTNAEVCHIEGGWPKDVDSKDVEQTIRLRKKVEKEPAYAETIKVLGEKLEHCIRQNNAIDIYEEYAQECDNNASEQAPSARTVNVLEDPSKIKRTATDLSWYPDNGRQIAVAYSVLDFQQMPANMSYDSYIWDMNNPKAPVNNLTPSSPCVSIQYNPKDPHIIAGGMFNGLVGYWDTRKGSQCLETTTVQSSHREPVYNVSWIQSKTGTEVMSASTDGMVLWWDIRKLGEPTETLTLNAEKFGEAGKLSAVSLDYDFSMPTKYLVGTEEGTVISCNRKAKNPADRIVQTYQGGHVGPVYSVKRSPFFQKIFLTVGDWTARLWSEDLRVPIMTTKNHRSYLMAGCWSPTRPGVFFTTKRDGTLDVWDYLYKQKDVTLSVNVSDSPLYSIKVTENGRYVACGSKDGRTTLLELNSGLYTIQPNEKQSLQATFELETRREKILVDRARDMMLKAKQHKAKPKTQGPSEVDIEAEEEAAKQLKAAEEEFFQAIEEFKANDKAQDRAAMTQPAPHDDAAPPQEQSQPVAVEAQ